MGTDVQHHTDPRAPLVGSDGTRACVTEHGAGGSGAASTSSARPADRPTGGVGRFGPKWMPRGSLLLVLLVAFSARMITAQLYPMIQGATSLSHGSDGYEHIGATLAAGHGFRFAQDLCQTMLLPPVYPLFLAVLFLFTGPSLFATTLVQSLLGAGSCYLLYILGKRHGGHRAGLLAALLYALYPGAWIGCSRYLTEPLFTLLLLGFLVFLSGFVRTGAKPGLIVAGVSGALAVLCKSVAGLLPVFLIICALFLPGWRHCRRRVLAGLTVCLLISLVAVAPWVYRNYKVSGSFVYPTTSGGLALYTAHVYAAHPDQTIRKSVHQAAREVTQLAVDNGIRLDPRDSYPRWFYTAQDEVKLDRLAQRVARQQMAGDPFGYVRHVSGNLWRFWWGAPSPKAIVLSVLINTPFMLLGAFGLYRTRAWRHPDLSLCLAAAMYLFMAHVGILAVVRYALTVMPILCLFGGLGVVEWQNRRRCDKSRRVDAGDVAPVLST